MTFETKAAKEAAYELLIAQQAALLEGETNLIANLANSSALLNQTLPDTVFAGYYLFEAGELILGPFQGNVSCVHIPLGKGVCGEAAETRQTVIMADAAKRQNYIACDSTAKSEIVVPLLKDEQLIGVLDIDSAVIGAFDEIDQQYLEQFAALLVN